MKYDFDKIIPRRGTNSYKWDSSPVGKDVLPLWVADMDFCTVPAITDALAKRVAHGIFGYSYVPDEYYTAVIRWFERRHNWSIRKEWLVQLLDYLKTNYDYLCGSFRTHMPQISVNCLEGTYLVWTDCRTLQLSSEVLQTRLLKETGLWLNSGTMYGAEGEGFLRWNIACPRAVLEDALARFQRFVQCMTAGGS